MRPLNRSCSNRNKSRLLSRQPLRRISITVGAISLLVCGAIFTAQAKPPVPFYNFPAQQQSKPQAFFGKVISQNGVRFILRDDENNVWYPLDEQEKAGKFLGKDVLVTGTYDGISGAIHVQNIVEAGPQDRPRPPQDDKTPATDQPQAEPSPPPSVDANNSSAPQALPPPPLVITAAAQPSDDRIYASNNPVHHSSAEMPTDPAPDTIPIPASFFSLPEESVSATSTVAISSRRFIPMPPDSSPDSQPPEDLKVGKMLRLVKPVYPEVAKDQGVEGLVRLRASIAEDGAVTNVETLSGPPPLAEAAASAVRDWRYSPTLLDGHRIQTQAEIRLVFRLAQ